MGNCEFISELNRLRKSSSDSIDNVEKFDDFKKYMHVTRSAEEDLKNILRCVNSSNKKTLVLLCGSAGDGKSHLLSYLKNSDAEHLIDHYTVYNDATESRAPSKTAIETLNDLLADFKDFNIGNAGKNVILAINLGVLSNLIESEYGAEFQLLKDYVEKNNILTTQININGYDSESYFQYVSFSDYNMFSLASDGVHPDYIENIMDKVFKGIEDNKFYMAYKIYCANCPLSPKCPVKKNYEYLMKKERQKFVAELLVKTTIQDKVILTTREILNFVYDILVAPEFSYTKLQKLLINDAVYLKTFLKQITPALLYDSIDLTTLMNILNKYDPLCIRTEKSDVTAIAYYASTNVEKQIGEAFSDTPYQEVVCNAEMMERINGDRLLKSQIYNLLVRIEYIDLSINQTDFSDEIYKKYLSDLYLFNAGQGRKLGSLYNMVEKGVIQWCGNDVDGNLCLDDRHSGFCLYEKVEFNANLDHMPKQSDKDRLQRFVPTIIIAFECDGNKNNIYLDIDYALYTLLFKLNKGYIQTADDRNNHADFISFVSRILQTGSLENNICVVFERGQRAVISRGMFGYKFKVVRQ